ncbi:MAG: CBS domain-containing protein [Candidatus Woesearchaeota archaeon]
MIPDLKEIKFLRRRLNLTQQELANRSGVSQSLIAKIESGRVDPTYTNAVRIFNALEKAREGLDLDIRRIMQRKLLSVPPDARISRAVEMMKRHEVSQLPVVDNEQVVGLVSEANILDSLMDGKGKNVSDIMQEPPPVVSQTVSVLVVSQLLRHYPLVLVAEKGKIKGVITKSDLLSGF